MFTFPFTNFSVDGWVNNLSTTFDGVDEYITVPDDASLDITSNLSVFFWVKAGADATFDPLLSKFEYTTNQRSWRVAFNARHLQVAIYQDVAGTNYKDYRTTGTWVANDLWHHVGFTFSNDNLKLWVDGVDRTPGTPTRDDTVTAIAVSTAPFEIGSLLDDPTYFTGQMDEVAIWDSTLSSTEITEIYNSGVPIDLRKNTGDYTSASSLVSYYRMGDGDTGTTLTDNKGSNDGTLTNMTTANYTTDVPS